MSTGNRPSTRTSLPLSERDSSDLALLRGSKAHRAALSRLVEVDLAEDSRDGALVHAVMEAGIKAVGDEVEAAGYVQVAGEMNAAGRRAVARRRA